MFNNAMPPHPRPFRPNDIAGCMRLFRSNLPHYFAPEEESQFNAFLRGLTRDDLYYVIESDGEVLACGGLALSADGATATFTWGMVDKERHGVGLGKILARHRIAVARTMSGVAAIHLDTSQFTRGFYAHMGFALVTVTPDGYGAGFDKCAMVLKLK